MRAFVVATWLLAGAWMSSGCLTYTVLAEKKSVAGYAGVTGAELGAAALIGLAEYDNVSYPARFGAAAVGVGLADCVIALFAMLVQGSDKNKNDPSGAGGSWGGLPTSSPDGVSAAR